MASNSIKKAQAPDPTKSFKAGDLKHPEQHTADTLVLSFLYELSKNLYTIDPTDATKVIPLDFQSVIGVAQKVQQQQLDLGEHDATLEEQQTLLEQQQAALAAYPAPELIPTFQPGTTVVSKDALPPVYIRGFEESATPVNGVPAYVPNVPEFKSILTELGVNFGGATTPVTQLKALMLFDGDSLVRAYLTPNPATDSFPQQMANTPMDSARFGPLSPVINIAQDGQTIDQMLARQNGYLLSQLTANKANYDMAIIYMGGGVNGVMQGQTAADLKAKAKQYITNIRNWQIANGNFPVLIIMDTLTKNGKQYGSLTLAQYESIRQQINADRMATYSTDYGADYLQNYDSDTRFSDTTNTVYFTDDGQHFTKEGQRVRALLTLPIFQAAQQRQPLAPAQNAPAAGTTQLGTPSISVQLLSTTSARIIRSNVANAESYTLIRATNAALTQNVVSVAMPAVSLDQTDLTASTAYYWDVQAVTTAAGYTSSNHAAATATTGSGAVQAPSQNLAELDAAKGLAITANSVTWVDQVNNTNVAATSTPAGASRLVGVLNGKDALRLDATALNGVVASGVKGAAGFQFIIVARFPDSSRDTNFNVMGFGGDVGGGTDPALGGTIADMLIFGGKLCVHTNGVGPASGAGENQSAGMLVSPWNTWGVFAVLHDGTNGYSYTSFSGMSQAKPVYHAGLLDTPIRIGGGHFESGGDFNDGVVDFARIIVQPYSLDLFNSTVADLKAAYGIA
jgi:hypothetical protein